MSSGPLFAFRGGPVRPRHPSPGDAGLAATCCCDVPAYCVGPLARSRPPWTAQLASSGPQGEKSSQHASSAWEDGGRTFPEGRQVPAAATRAQSILRRAYAPRPRTDAAAPRSTPRACSARLRSGEPPGKGSGAPEGLSHCHPVPHGRPCRAGRRVGFPSASKTPPSHVSLHPTSLAGGLGLGPW